MLRATYTCLSGFTFVLVTHTCTLATHTAALLRGGGLLQVRVHVRDPRSPAQGHLYGRAYLAEAVAVPGLRDHLGDAQH